MRSTLLVLLLMAISCGDSTSPEPGQPINVEGEFAASVIEGQTVPVEAGVFECDGEEVPLFILSERVGLYDDNSDPTEEDGTYRTRRTGTEDGDCWTEVVAWGTYRATTDSILFSWPEAVPVGPAVWTDEGEAFDADVPEGRTSFERSAATAVPPRAVH